MAIATLGTVETFEGEQVETDFSTLFGTLPLFPQGSFYRRSEDQRYPIKLHPKSLIKGLLSYHALYLAGAAICYGITYLETAQAGLAFMLALVCGLLSGFARFRLGASTPRDLRRRAVHLEITGVGSLPSMLPRDLVETLREALDRKWTRRHGEADWREAIDGGESPASDLKLLAVLANLEAHLERGAATRARARAAWAALEACQEEALESLSPEEALVVLRAPTPQRARRGIKIRCERCDHVTRVPDRCAGQTGRCPSCDRAVRVPSKKSMRLLAA